MMRSRILLGLFLGFVLVATSSIARGLADEVKIGDDAPDGYLDGISWLKELKGGEPTTSDMPVVVEFWATWCEPCKRAIPHLTELQEKYGPDRLSIIGVTWPDEKQTSSDIKRYVQRQGKRMDYWVGMDKQGKAAKDLFKASKIPIPFAFIIGSEGRLQFLGHPMDPKFEEVLDKVVKGRYDHKSFQKAKRHLDEIKKARTQKNWDQYYKLSNQVLEIDARIFYDIYIERFDVELLDRSNSDKAYADARVLIVDRMEDPELLAWLGAHIATSPDIPDDQRNLDVALELVQSARQKAGLNQPKLTVLEAQVRMARGEVEEAVKLQRDAYRSAPQSNKDAYKRMLQDYKAHLKRDQG